RARRSDSVRLYRRVQRSVLRPARTAPRSRRAFGLLGLELRLARRVRPVPRPLAPRSRKRKLGRMPWSSATSSRVRWLAAADGRRVKRLGVAALLGSCTLLPRAQQSGVERTVGTLTLVGSARTRGDSVEIAVRIRNAGS